MSEPSSPTEENIFQFSTFQSFVSPTFWHKLSEIKLDYDRLSDAPKPIYGFYTNRHAKSCLLEVDYTAFNSETFNAPIFCHIANGILYNKNTIEEFKECDKQALLLDFGKQLIEDFKSDQILKTPNLLARFIVLSFADLKNHNYYYWFAFPCFLTKLISCKPKQKLIDVAELQPISDFIKTSIPFEQQNFFIINVKETMNYYTLEDFVNLSKDDFSDFNNFYFCFADASQYDHPSWFLRLFIAFLTYKCPILIGKKIKCLGLRYDNYCQADNSLVWEVKQDELTNLDDLKLVGWEPNKNKRMGPRMVSMRDSMDPTALAENSIHLNLKLMKWRLVPDLNLEIITKTKCLLFGAGTLGCAVTRNLLGWGISHITFIDNGKVSFANPVRQCLYTQIDARTGNAMKATTAAACIKNINPAVTSTGYVMQIPMPGHTIGESLIQQTTEDLETIKKLVQEHDVIFLLTDSRESRWLPTLLGAAYNKIVINSALGFDSYLVMRHGSSDCTKSAGDCKIPTQEIDNLKCITGDNLGCYFCNDVTAPGNSLKDRTLDQQCTVTRPGVSNIAASYAVELLISILQHPIKNLAPAYFSVTGKTDAKVPEGLLGILPHSIRGLLFNFENILPATQKFPQCIACSEKVLNEFREYGNNFLFKAFETAKFLEDLTGISNFENLSSEIIDFDDSDLEMFDE